MNKNIPDRYGEYVHLHEELEVNGNEDALNGLEGDWDFIDETELNKLYYQFEMNQEQGKTVNEELENQIQKRLDELAKLAEDDISKVVGYKVTVYNSNRYRNLPNDAESGKWFIKVKYECSNCGREYKDESDIYEHESCNHKVCSECGERHLEDCEFISKQNH